MSAIIEYQFFMKIKYILLILFLNKLSLKPQNNCVLKSIQECINEILIKTILGLANPTDKKVRGLALPKTPVVFQQIAIITTASIHASIYPYKNDSKKEF